MALEKVRKGERFRPDAASHNAFVDAARAHQASAHRLGPATVGGMGSQTLVWVQNQSGEDRDQFDVLGLAAPIFTYEDNPEEFKTRLVFGGVEPAATDHREKFCILQQPLKDDGIGLAVIAGLTPCRVDIQIEGDGWANIFDGEYDRLKSGEGDTRILWAESGTGTKWAAVLLGQGPPMRLGITTSELLPRASCTVAAQAGQPGSEAATGENVTCWDWLLGDDQSIAPGTHVYFVRANGALYIPAAACSSA
jgi:hypothetical protein